MVREAALSDVPELLKMAERFIGAAWTRIGVPFDMDTCRDLLCQLIYGREDFVLTSNAVDCMMGVYIHPWHFNRSVLTATELFWWAEPNCREAMTMIDRAECIVSDRGAKTFNMGALSHLRGAALGKLYERRGYAPSEIIHIKELG